MKKIFSMFIAIIIVFTISPIFAIAEETSGDNNLSKESTGFEAYNIWVAGIQVTDANKGGITGTGITGNVSYDADTNTLTLNNANITYGSGNTIYTEQSDLIVVLEGENIVTSTSNNDDAAFNTISGGDITFKGSGSLNTRGKYSGIYAFEDIFIESGTIISTGEKAGISNRGGITISGGNLRSIASKTGGYGICKDGGWLDITVSGDAVVTALGENDAKALGRVKSYTIPAHYMMAGNDEGSATLIDLSDGSIQEKSYISFIPGKTISGIIMSSEEESPVGEAKVQIQTNNGTDFGTPTTTLADGKYITQALPDGNYKIQISKNGYITQVIYVNVPGDNLSEKDVFLNFDPSYKLTGTANISNRDPRIGEVLIASIEDSNNAGTLTYIWKANGTNVGTGTSYTVTAVDFGKVITLEITSSVQIGTITSSTTEVRKILATSAPGAPVLSSKTNSSVTLTANAAYEFSKDKISWQTSNVFNSLAANTAYTFYQRVAETSDTEASEAGSGLTVTTDSISGGGSNKGGGGSNIESPTETISTNVTVIPPTPKNPEAPTHGVIKIPIVGSNGNFTAKITDKTITEAFEKALADAKKNGKEKNGIGIILRVDADIKTGTNITVNLPKAVQDTIISNKIVNTIVVGNNSDISVGMDLATVQEINRQASSDVNITATFIDSSKLSDEAKKAIGNRLALDFKVRYGNGNLIKDFGEGSVEIEMPYTLGENENLENVRAVYIDDNGNIKWLENSRYDSTKKVVRFNTNHFSTYGIGYKQKVTEFTDIESHWAKKDIEFVVNRGLLGGTSANTFSPNITMTRGMFVTSLGRLANADTSNYKNSSFNDVKKDSYYMGYIEWASKNKIINGVSSGKFAPNQPITREQVAIIMQNYAKTIDVKMPNNLFETKGIATRAEVSAILNRFMELINSSK